MEHEDELNAQATGAVYAIALVTAIAGVVISMVAMSQ
jgi:hypothetical protein